MITFSCSCGKKYQLPDRHAGREVRCNQCGNPFIVPHASTEAEETETSQTEVVKQDAAKNTAQDAAQWGSVPVPNGEKNEQSPIVTGWATGPYQKGSSCILTIVLVLLGAGTAFFGGFIMGGLLHRIEPMNHGGHFDAYEEEFAEPESVSSTSESAPIVETKTYTAADWAVNWESDGNEPIPFIAKAVDGGKILLSLDGDPITAGEKQNTLDDVAAALATDTDKANEKPLHSRTLKINSESSAVFRFIWSPPGVVNLDAGKFKSIRFSLCIPDKPNAVFKPGKPEGIDKTLVLSTFGLRLVTESGFIDFIPENKEKFVAVFDRAKSGWVSVQIPISGDETWKRTDNGTFGSQTVHRIELYAKPTGTGAAVWIDNLGIEE